jgi:hypothetical protein
MATQEYAEDAASCFLASGDCIFDVALLDRRMQEILPPREYREGAYLLGVDPAGGGSEGDFSVIQAVDMETGLQCAEWQARAPVREAAALAAKLAGEYNRALLAVERNNHGSGLLAHLEGQGVAVYEQGGVQGWPTTASTRPAMLQRLEMALAADAGVFQSSRLLAECRTMVRQRNGKAAAAAGCHDDCVMAMAVALSVRAERMQAGKK